MDVCMAGRVAEELIFGAAHVTSGASSDFEQATSIARNMVPPPNPNPGVRVRAARACWDREGRER